MKCRWNRPVRSAHATPDTTIYTYDLVGNLETVSAPPSQGQSVRNTTTYEYFDNGWIQESVDAWDITTTYDYNQLGQPTINRRYRRMMVRSNCIPTASPVAAPF